MARPKDTRAIPKSGRRRQELRRSLPKQTLSVRMVFARPDVIKTVLLLTAFFAITSAIVITARMEPMVYEGQVVAQTRLKRLDYQIEDTAATEEKREEARRSAPRVYAINDAYLDRLSAALLGLPRAVAGKRTLDELTPELIAEYALTAEALTALQEFIQDNEVAPQWERSVARLVEELKRKPLLRSSEFQHFTQTFNRAVIGPDGRAQPMGRVEPIELRTGDGRPEFLTRLREIVLAGPFPQTLVPHIEARIAADDQPTLTFDAAATERQAQLAIAAVEPVMIEHKAGEVLFRRGDTLRVKHLEDVRAEHASFLAQHRPFELWLPAAGVAALLALIVGFLAVHIVHSYPRITRNTMRVAAMTGLMLAMLGLTVAIATKSPNLMHAAAIGPTLLVAIIVLLAYDQRLALILSALQAALVTLALGQGVGWFILLFVGSSAIIALLRDVRHRNSLVRAALIAAIVLAAGSIALGIAHLPIVPGAISQILWSALWAGLASFAVGFLMLGILPSVERVFDITTGMTLAELRDPKQPLLRQLQQRAPGTYNHSLQVANIAEAAADAIGADSLLVYVGALYHDIGKMNKPEYFVENQAGGVNKHDKLSPAMSLLVIVGHVKDGIELAREYGLPRKLQHFIESHHGTTLVEYFYHAARSQAKPDRDVAEVEFRYPGPKPRTKEAAILMLSDAVESATRAMAEPNASRIESLVRDLSRKRLVDGQFDNCDLTFRELGLIEDAVISRLCAIYHGRLSYPKDEEPPITGERVQQPPGLAVPLPKAASA